MMIFFYILIMSIIGFVLGVIYGSKRAVDIMTKMNEEDIGDKIAKNIF